MEANPCGSSEEGFRLATPAGLSATKEGGSGPVGIIEVCAKVGSLASKEGTAFVESAGYCAVLKPLSPERSGRLASSEIPPVSYSEFRESRFLFSFPFPFMSFL